MFKILTRYQLDTARVKISLPLVGDCWFFIGPEETVESFKEKCTQEDSGIETIKVLRSGKQTECSTSTNLYEALQDIKEPLYLKLNNITYQFDTQKGPVSFNASSQKSVVKDQLTKAGLGSIHGSTLSSILHQMENKMDI